MATPEILQTEQDLLMYAALFENSKDGNVKSRGMEIEKKIEFLEGLAGRVSNRRSRRWINDRLLMELVPRLNAEEIRGLFAPPPWGDDVPPSPFCMTNVGEWDNFRNIDMDKEQSRDRLDADKVAALTAWHRVDGRTREALRRCYLSDLINGYEECIRAFVKDSGNGDVLVLHVQDPFHRLLLHGVCEFYNLVSTTVTESKGSESSKTTRIKKKQSVSPDPPNITLSNFLKMAKEGFCHGWGTDRGIIVTGPAPSGSGYDFYTRFFCPKLGADEDHLSSVVLLLLLISSSQFIMAKKPVRYCVVDAFTDSAYKGNPAAVCLLEEERDEEWMQAVAREFNISETCYLTRLSDSAESLTGSVPRFRLRWFTPVAEVKLCGHATLAASHFLFAYNLVKSHTIEFLTLSGILTAKRVPETKVLDLPETLNGEVSAISKSLGGASVNEIHKTTTDDDLIVRIPLSCSIDVLFLATIANLCYLSVVLPSGEAVAELEPNFGEIQKCPGRGIIITGLAPAGSGFDFFSRFFCPKLGIGEDPVCGSAHCALAPYWSKKLGKSDFIAYQASPRSGVLHLHLDAKNQRVLLRGKAVAVMEVFLNENLVSTTMHIQTQNKHSSAPLQKTSPRTNLYNLLIYLKTPLLPSKLHLDLVSYLPWYHCASHYNSSSYQPIYGNSTLCTDLNPGILLLPTALPVCFNDSCGFFPENPVTWKIATEELLMDKFALPQIRIPGPGPVSELMFSCTDPTKFSRIYRGLAK
ncbi:putative isomerase [Sesamum angolense]|uniref:Isomerase n=1 Tax=Sesamum angolense TaxID=2727404 RepID=A0AAE2C319_9LAMI|nr:putative isomerase [Sesamum angolense]